MDVNDAERTELPEGWIPSDSLTDEQIDEIGAARHLWGYPGIVDIRRRIRDGYVSASGVHYAGAERDADKLLDIVDSLYETLERERYERKQADRPGAEQEQQS